MSDITHLPFLPSLTPFSLLLSFQLPHFSDNDTGECGEQQEEGFYSPSERRNVCVFVCHIPFSGSQWVCVLVPVYVLAFIYCPCMGVNTEPEE